MRCKVQVKREILDELADYCQGVYDLGKIVLHDGFYSIEKDLKAAFKIKKDFILDTFAIQAQSAKSFKGIPLKCAAGIDQASKNLILHTFENLLTGETLEVSKLNLSNNRIDENDLYEFWVVWLKNPNRLEAQENYLLPVITRPLDIKEEKEIKMNF